MFRAVCQGIAIGSVLLVVGLGCAASSADNPSTAASGVKPEEMAGLDFSPLTDAQVVLAASVLNQHPCDCGCGMTVGTCRRDDSTCSRSLELGGQVISLIRQGKTPDQVRFALQTQRRPSQPQAQPAAAGATQYVEFKIPTVGNEPFLGPEEAPVTILHYLDFQ